MANKIIKLIICILAFLFFNNVLEVNATPNVIINEIAWAGMTEGWRYEWVELFNGSGNVVDITGWQIENGASSNKTLVLSAGVIPANGYFLVCRKEMTECDVVETKLSLHNEYGKNGKLVLKNSSGGMIDSTPIPEGKTWPGGDNDGKQTMEWTGTNWQTSAEPNGTPKTQNSSVSIPPPEPAPEPEPEPVSPESDPTELAEGWSDSDIPEPDLPAEAAFDAAEEGFESESEPSHPEPSGEGTQDPSDLPQDDTVQEPQPIKYPKNIFINEILPSPKGADAENEWIELYNGNDFEVTLTGWQVQDTIGAVRTYTFPTDIKINPLGFLVLERTETKITLQNSGDSLKLLNPNQEIVYSIDYPKAPQGQSYNKTGKTWSWSTVLTPAEQNIISQPSQTKPSETGSRETEPSETGSRITGNEGNTLANIEKTLPKTSSHILTFIFAVIIAVGSGVIVLFLKKTTKKY